MIEIEKKWKKRVIELEKQIRLAKEEITMIQMSCDHNEYHIGYYGWIPSSKDTIRFCSICDLPLTPPTFEPPTEKEYNQFMEEDNDGQGKKIYCNETD